ncbi:CoB--CoM heterodisulfide reductase 2 iron-sulfur subunit D [Minicystis rosea]|nr:CoB--CoM heterodisulfide reductase 2 iron-sulfur subunit D [Minicystis rosea]
MTSLRLPLLEPHRASLETCVYCPKLSRAACPVSNAEHSETVTPWGKMSLAFFAARGDVPLDREHAAPAWACTGCYACRERCDHKNEVATVLTDARAELFAAEAAPEGARRVAAGFAARAVEIARAVDALDPAPKPEGAAAVLIGCSYARHAPEVAADALRATGKLLDKPVRALRSCCGLPLLHAGDRTGFMAAARRLVAELADTTHVVAVDPGCARTLLVEYPRLGVEVPRPELFIDLAARSQSRLRPMKDAPAFRYHDPCQLGRGLGRYEPPRTILARIGGRAPLEMVRHGQHAECSGGGGLLPATRPETSRAIAEARIAEHRAEGGGVLVTACAESLRRFRKSGEPAEDIVSLVARALLDDGVSRG